MAENENDKKAGLFGRMFGRGSGEREAVTPVPRPGDPSHVGADRRRATPASTEENPHGGKSWFRALVPVDRAGHRRRFTARKLDSAALEDLETFARRSRVAASARIVEAVGKGRYEKEVSADEVKAIPWPKSSGRCPPSRGCSKSTRRKAVRSAVVGVNGPARRRPSRTDAAPARRRKSVTLAAGDTFRAAASSN